MATSETATPNRSNMAHLRQSRPDSGLGFQVRLLTTFHAVPSSLGSGGYREGLVCKTNRIVYHSTLVPRAITKKKKVPGRSLRPWRRVRLPPRTGRTDACRGCLGVLHNIEGAAAVELNQRR